jgi:UDP-glucuronate 4-epimerase
LISTPKLGADVLETRADVAKARQLLGYDPKVSVPEGVEHFWNWYRGAVLKQ